MLPSIFCLSPCWYCDVIIGKIRSWFWFSEYGLMVYSMSRNRYCERIGRQHKSNHGNFLFSFSLFIFLFFNFCICYLSLNCPYSLSSLLNWFLAYLYHFVLKTPFYIRTWLGSTSHQSSCSFGHTYYLLARRISLFLFIYLFYDVEPHQGKAL